jgi:hypothetical protein
LLWSKARRPGDKSSKILNLETLCWAAGNLAFRVIRFVEDQVRSDDEGGVGGSGFSLLYPSSCPSRRVIHK